MKNIILPAFILLVFAQWLIPAQMIWQKDKVSSEGYLHRFQTAPVDPSDPFMGKYVALNFKETSKTMSHNKDRYNGLKIYVTFFTDNNGYAQIRDISRTIPLHTKDFLETTINYTVPEGDSDRIYINYPFNRFYMEEYKAKQAEGAYNNRSADTSNKTYALVSIHEGDAVIKDVFINDSSITDVIRKINSSRKD